MTHERAADEGDAMTYTPRGMREMANVFNSEYDWQRLANATTAAMLRQGADAVESLAAKDAEIARLTAGNEEQRESIQQVKAVLGLLAGGIGLSLADDVRVIVDALAAERAKVARVATLARDPEAWMYAKDKRRAILAAIAGEPDGKVSDTAALAAIRAQVRTLRETCLDIADRDVGDFLLRRMDALGLTGEEP
jgi:hypothetical protein